MYMYVSICAFKMKMAPKRTIANLYPSKYYRGKKTKNLPRTTSFASWSFNRCFKRKPPAQDNHF